MQTERNESSTNSFSTTTQISARAFDTSTAFTTSSSALTSPTEPKTQNTTIATTATTTTTSTTTTTTTATITTATTTTTITTTTSEESTILSTTSEVSTLAQTTEEFSDTCADIDCENGGTCMIENGVPVCKCLVSYSGRYCQCGPEYRQITNADGHHIKKDWDKARAYCSDRGEHLTFFLTREEYLDYVQIYRESDLDEWIGYEQIYQSQDNSVYNYTTVNGQIDAYMNWERGEPNNWHEKCVELYSNARGTMNDLMCNIELPFSCRFSQECL